jgi:rhodanese-related sulfurtransferase
MMGYDGQAEPSCERPHPRPAGAAATTNSPGPRPRSAAGHALPLTGDWPKEQGFGCRPSSSGGCRVVAVPAGAGSTGEPIAAATAAQRDVILSAAEVQPLLGQPGIKLIDTRSRKDFAKGHLPGAISLPWQELNVSERDGMRNELATDEELARRFGAAGLSYDDTIILCDATTLAGRGYVAFEYAGFTRIHVLDGGFGQWTGPAQLRSSARSSIGRWCRRLAASAWSSSTATGGCTSVSVSRSTMLASSRSKAKSCCRAHSSSRYRRQRPSDHDLDGSDDGPLASGWPITDLPP